MAQLKQTLAETCYDRCNNSIHEAHKEDLTQLANQPEARESYQQAIKQTVRQHFVAGLHSDIIAQISAKLQSLDTKQKLLTTVAEIEAAVRPKKRRSSPHGDCHRSISGNCQNPQDAERSMPSDPDLETSTSSKGEADAAGNTTP